MNDTIITLRQTELYIGLGYLRPKTLLNVIETLFVNILIRTVFKNKYVTSI